MLVLVTRPRDQAAVTARRLAELGHAVLVDPVLEVRPLPVPSPDTTDTVAIALTSGHAVPALAGLDAALPVFAVGEATAAAARAAGRRHVRQAAGDGRALASLIGESLPAPAPERRVVLHPAGADVRPGLEQALRALGFGYRRLTVYAAVPTEGPAPEVEAALRDGRLDAVLLYSPRSAALWAERILARRLEEHLAGTIAACLSRAVAEPLAGLPLRAVRIAAVPEQKSLLGCLEAPV